MKRRARKIVISMAYAAVVILITGCADVDISKRQSESFHVVKEITCEGKHPLEGHLQGLVSDRKHIYWAFTTELVKTDLDGNLLMNRIVNTHHGDLTYHDKKLYVSFVRTINSKAVSRVKVYSAEDLSFIKEYDIEVFEDYIGTLDYYDNHFYIGEDFWQGLKNPKIHKYDLNFNYIESYTIDILLTKGFENVARFADCWWASSYDSGTPMLKLDDNFEIVEPFSSGFPYGFKQWSEDVVLTGKLDCNARWMKYE